MANKFLNGIDTTSLSVNSQYSLPTSDGSNKQVLTTDGNGNVTFSDVDLVGAQAHYVYYEVKNSTGVTIPKGTGVMAVGTDGNSGHILISPMVADGSIEPQYFIGITADAIGNGQTGNVIHFGMLSSVNTTAFNDGDVLYCDPANDGGFTVTEPDGPNLKLAVAFIVNSATNGKMFIRVQGNEGLHQLHDVSANPVSTADGDLLQWNATSKVWENKTLADIADSRYVNVSGDTMSGNLTISGSGYRELKVDQTDSASVRLGVSSGSTEAFVFADNTGAGHVTGNASIKMLMYDSNSNIVESGRFTTTGLDVTGNVLASSFIKDGGTSSQFLKADGSVDSNSYITDITTQTDPKYLRSDTNDFFTGRLANISLNQTPAYGGGAINLQPATAGGSTGIVLRSKVNDGSDFGFIWWYDDNDHYNTLNSTENGVLVIGIQNDGGATSMDSIAIESTGDIYLNAGVASGDQGAGTYDTARGDVYVGDGTTRYKVWHSGNSSFTSNGLGANFTDPVTIYDASTTENPRLSVGRGDTQRLSFSVDDGNAYITHRQDETNAPHALYFTIDSPTTSGKGFYWHSRLADGTSANEYMHVDSTGLDVNGSVVATSFSGNGANVTNVNADLWDGYQFADYLNQGVRTSDSPSWGSIKVTSTADATGIELRNSNEVISGESWCTAFYSINDNDGWLFVGRDASDNPHPIFHIGGYNNAGNGGYDANDSIITLSRNNGTKATGAGDSDNGLSTSTEFINIVKRSDYTYFKDNQGEYRFSGLLRAENMITVNGDYLIKELGTPYFTNGVANLACDIHFGNNSFWGYIEVHITSTYSNQNSAGSLIYRYSVGTNPNGSIYVNSKECIAADGTITSNINLDNFYWDSTNSTYAIPISHIVSTGNSYSVLIKMFTHSSGAYGAADDITIGGLYTKTALNAPYQYNNGPLGVGGTSGVKLIGDSGSFEVQNASGTGTFKVYTTGYTSIGGAHTADSPVHMKFSTTGELLQLSNTSSGAYTQIGFQQQDSDGLHHRAYIRAERDPDGGNAAGTLHLMNRGVGAGQQKTMTLRASGKVGILQESPNRELTVNGEVSGTRFYKYGNESYYLDPNSESILKRIRCGTSTSDNNGTVSLSLNDGSLHMRSVTDYNHKMWYYDGIAFSTNPSHGHFRFYGDSVQRNNATGGSTLRFDIDVQNAITTCHGELRSTGDVIAYSSDERLKTNIKQIPDAIEKVKALKGVTYDWVENIEDLGFKPRNKKDDVGLIAQDLEKVLPQVVAPAPFDHEMDDEKGEMVSKSGEGYKTVQYDKVVPLLIEAIKEQQKQIDELKAMIYGDA